MDDDGEERAFERVDENKLGDQKDRAEGVT